MFPGPQRSVPTPNEPDRSSWRVNKLGGTVCRRAACAGLPVTPVGLSTSPRQTTPGKSSAGRDPRDRGDQSTASPSGSKGGDGAVGASLFSVPPREAPATGEQGGWEWELEGMGGVGLAPGMPCTAGSRCTPAPCGLGTMTGREAGASLPSVPRRHLRAPRGGLQDPGLGHRDGVRP